MIFSKYLLLFSIVFATILDALTLDEVLDNALDKNPEIVEKEKRYEEIYYDVQMAKSGYLPKLDFTGTSQLEDSRVINRNDNVYDVELALTQNIFNGFGDINKHRLELSKYKSAFYATKELKNSFSLEVIKAYLNLIKEKDMQNIQNASVQNHENIFNKTTIKYDAGLGNRLEYRLSNTSLHLAKINYHEQKNFTVQAKITLEKYLNGEIDMDTLTYPEYDVKIPSTFHEALEIALKNHPSMLVARLNKEMSDYELKYSKKDLYPSLDLKANYYSGENNMYKSIYDEYYEIGLKLSYNLYNGQYDISSKRKMQSKTEQKDALIEKTRRDIAHKLKSVYDDYLILKEKKVLIDYYVDLKALTLESYYEEFSIGKALLRDILDTTESLYAAKKMQVNSQFDLLISKYGVLEAMGQLPEIKYLDSKIIKQNTDEGLVVNDFLKNNTETINE